MNRGGSGLIDRPELAVPALPAPYPVPCPGTGANMVVRTIVHFEIPAEDIAMLSRFYRSVFGWKFTNARMPGMDYWQISTGPPGRSVGGGMYRKMGPNERPRNFVRVERIDAAIARFKEAGGTEVTGKMEVPGMGYSFIGEDPEGNLLALWEPVRARPRRSRSSTRTRRARGTRP
jgi:uncharacterized protein